MYPIIHADLNEGSKELNNLMGIFFSFSLYRYLIQLCGNIHEKSYGHSLQVASVNPNGVVSNLCSIRHLFEINQKGNAASNNLWDIFSLDLSTNRKSHQHYYANHDSINRREKGLLTIFSHRISLNSAQ